MKAQECMKAIVAGVVAGGGALSMALLSGNVTPLEVIGVVIITVVAAGAVFQVPNAPREARTPDGDGPLMT